MIQILTRIIVGIILHNLSKLHVAAYTTDFAGKLFMSRQIRLQSEREIKMLDWYKAEEHLTASEKEYAVMDTAGYLVLIYVISPLRDRLNKGERTKELWNDIMDV
jgi:hypothetical protein